MNARSLQLFSLFVLFANGAIAQNSTLERGRSYTFSLRDVDGNDLAIADGHVTVITVVTRRNEDDAHAVADHVPDRCLGNPKYRYITLVNFQRKLARPLHGLTRRIIRNRLDAEARALKPEYEAKHLTRDPRRDVFVVADFDGSAVAHLGVSPESDDVAVFVFDGRGKLINNWNSVPDADSIAQAIGIAER